MTKMSDLPHEEYFAQFSVINKGDRYSGQFSILIDYHMEALTETQSRTAIDRSSRL